MVLLGSLNMCYVCSISVQVIDIEKEIDYGQIEELISFAHDELELIEYYYGEYNIY